MHTNMPDINFIFRSTPMQLKYGILLLHKLTNLAQQNLVLKYIKFITTQQFVYLINMIIFYAPALK